MMLYLGPLISAVIGAVFGHMAAVVTFREKLSVGARDQAHAREIAELKAKQSDERVDAMETLFLKLYADSERRQRAMLGLLVDIAGSMGVKHRFSDFLPNIDNSPE